MCRCDERLVAGSEARLREVPGKAGCSGAKSVAWTGAVASLVATFNALVSG